MFKFLFKSAPTIPTITPQELQERLQNDKSLLVLDVRTPGEYTADGHIHRSRLMPLSDLPQQKNKLPTDKTIVCVCRSGNRSRSACKKLINAGFTDVINLKGGMMAWSAANLPTQTKKKK